MHNLTRSELHIPLPDEAVREIVHDTDLDDERLWVPRGDSIWSLPLMFNVSTGAWVNITRAKGTGVISRHRHSSPVTGYTRMVPGGMWNTIGPHVEVRSSLSRPVKPIP